MAKQRTPLATDNTYSATSSAWATKDLELEWTYLQPRNTKPRCIKVCISANLANNEDMFPILKRPIIFG